MSRSAIIINTPKTCEDCPGLIQIDEHSLPICVYANKLKFYADKPHWCPLVELKDGDLKYENDTHLQR